MNFNEFNEDDMEYFNTYHSLLRRKMAIEQEMDALEKRFPVINKIWDSLSRNIEEDIRKRFREEVKDELG